MRVMVIIWSTRRRPAVLPWERRQRQPSGGSSRRTVDFLSVCPRVHFCTLTSPPLSAIRCTRSSPSGCRSTADSSALQLFSVTRFSQLHVLLEAANVCGFKAGAPVLLLPSGQPWRQYQQDRPIGICRLGKCLALSSPVWQIGH